MKRLLLSLVLLSAWPFGGGYPSSAPFAISVVQTTTGRVDDAAVTFGSAWGASNHVVVAGILNTKVGTASLSGVTTTVNTLAGPLDHPSDSIRAYVWCFQGDGSDSSFNGDTSTGNLLLAIAVEISGGSCTLDGSAQSTSDNASPYELVTDLSTTQAGSFIIGAIHARSASDYTVTGSGNSLPSDGTDLGVGLGQYYIAGGAGSYDTTYTSAAPETSWMIAAAIQAAGGGGGAPPPPRGLLTLGCCR